MSVYEAKPYRYQGIPDWNPAAVPAGGVRDARRYGEAALKVECPKCFQPPGRMCRSPSGKKVGQPHIARLDAAERPK